MAPIRFPMDPLESLLSSLSLSFFYYPGQKNIITAEIFMRDRYTVRSCDLYALFPKAKSVSAYNS